MTVAEILQEIVKIGHRYQAKEVVLFGSRAKGTAAERSDIDIAISGCRDFDRCRDEIDNIPTLYSIDVVNMDTCANELLMEDIRKYGRKIL